MFNISNSNQSPTFTSQCDDKDSRCPSWAAFQNQCTTNREFMNRSVKLSQIRNKVKGWYQVLEVFIAFVTTVLFGNLTGSYPHLTSFNKIPVI
jgi:hypothetical protein